MTDLPQPRTYYVNLYRGLAGSCGSVYETRSIADQMAGASRVACKRVEIAPGDGLTDGEEDEPAETREA